MNGEQWSKGLLQRELVESEWGEWKQHPVTKAFFAYITLKREEGKERWADGNFTQPDAHGTVQQNSASIGTVKAFKDLLELNFEGINEAFKDD